MDKEKYFQTSEKLGLPNRCPILSYCSRRAWTIYFLNRYIDDDRQNDVISKLIEEGEISTDFEKTCIPIQGELPGGALGQNNGYFHDLCPEVNLFDRMNAMDVFRGTACASGSYDFEGKPDHIIREAKHFSQCPEFSKYVFDLRIPGLTKNLSMERIKPKDCYTYLMYDKRDCLYKIGISHNPNYREKTLQGQQPQIDLLAVKKFQSKVFAKNLETELHLKYKEKRIRGEWFRLSHEDVSEIQKSLSAN